MRAERDTTHARIEEVRAELNPDEEASLDRGGIGAIAGVLDLRRRTRRTLNRNLVRAIAHSVPTIPAARSVLGWRATVR